MKISRISLRCIASFIFLACNISYAEFIKGKNSDSYYICSYSKLRSQSSSSKEDAIDTAELNATEEFIRFAVGEKMILPKGVEKYYSRIAKVIELNVAMNLQGAKVAKSSILKDGRAVCVLEIPKYNLKNFASLDFSKAPHKLIEHIKNSKTLALELSLAMGIRDFDVVFPKGSLLNAVVSKNAISLVPRAWFFSKEITKENLSPLSDDSLLAVLEFYFGIDAAVAPILLEIKDRGFLDIFKFFKEQELSKKTNIIALDEFKSDIDFINILQKNNASIDFLNSSAYNEKFEQAKAEFESKSPDLSKIRDLLFESFLESLSDSAMNLLGRAFEEDSMLKEAVIIYAQALSMNKNQPYAKYNLANCYYKLSMHTEALFWINETLSDNSSSNWAKESAKNLLDLINNPPQDTKP